MDCSTFFFDSSEQLDRAVSLLRDDGIESGSFSPSPADASLRVWAVSVERVAGARAKELIISANLTPFGFYDLPQAERPLPQAAATNDSAGADDPLIKKIWLVFVAQCFADPRKIRLIAHHDGDTGPLMPYLNATVKSAQYNPGGPTLSFKKGIRMITLYPKKIAIAKADDLLDAWLCLKDVRDRICDVHDRKNEIVPDFSRSDPPGPLDMYKLLPQTNCGLCESLSCLAFAARLAAGEVDPDDCPLLKKSEYAEKRFQLFGLLGESP